MTSDARAPLARISFNPVVGDYAAVYVLALTKTTNDYRWWARLVLCVASWSATAVSLLTAGALSIQSASTAAVCSLVFILFLTARLWPDPAKAARQRYSPALHPELYRQRTLQLEENGIRLASEMTEFWLSWKIINRVILTEEHLLITSKSTTMFAPVRAFANRDAFLEFARIAQARYTPTAEETNARGFEVVMKKASKDENKGES